MRMQFRPLSASVAIFLLISCFLLNCDDQKEQSKALVVSKKISIQKPIQSEPKSDEAKAEASVEKTEVDNKESGAVTRIYDPTERLNPFIPIFAKDEDSESAASDQVDQKKKKKRIAQTPLERIGLNQLKLVAIIRASSGNRALVEDSSGKGYIIRKGTYIGLNSGIVAQINANSVIIEEELENLMGELVLQNTEIKLQKPAGE